MDNNFVIKLNDFLEKILNSIHFDNSDINYELNNLHNIFNEKVVSFLEEYTVRANEYYKQREEYSNKNVDPVNEKVKVIIKNIKGEYLKLFNEELTYSVASSYSAKMNLIGESDIDYFILFKPLTTEKLIKISQLLEKYNFKFQKVRNIDKIDNVYYVYDQVIDGIEVEVKVRDLMYSRSVVALHNYIDNKLDHNLKVLLTYAKYQLKLKSKEDKSFKGYDMFKTIFYNYCFKDIEDAYYIII
jgi:hypothetical protein